MPVLIGSTRWTFSVGRVVLLSRIERKSGGAVAVAVAIAIAIAILAIAGCGGADSSSSTQGSKAKPQNVTETPTRAAATGRQQCRQLGGLRVLKSNFRLSSPSALAAKYSRTIYIGDYPKSAARGCRSVLK